MIVLPYKNRIISGEITIFLSLLLSGFLGLMSVLIDSSRLQIIRMNIESVMDMGLHSCFGEYDKNLFNRYDLLFIDSSYRGGSEAGIDSVINHLTEYIDENICYENENVTGEWYKESLKDAVALQYIYASDEDGKVLENQACDYIENYGTYKYISKINANKGNVDINVDVDFFGEWDDVLALIDSYGADFTNPSKILRQTVLSYNDLLINTDIGSLNGINIPSERELNCGVYDGTLITDISTEDAFTEYLMQKFGCYTEYYDEQRIIPELEYVIFGEKSGIKNMENMIELLMSMREADNLSCIMGDDGKVYSARNLAEKVLGPQQCLLYGDELIILVEKSIIYAWAYAESVVDVTGLINKGCCPVKKNSSNIALTVEDILTYRSKLGITSNTGLTYKEYMGVLIAKMPDNIRRKRCMDIIESNIRTYVNDRFRIDGCVSYLKAKIELTSGYGYGHNITRDYIY